MKEEFTAHDMATAAADGFRNGQKAAQSAPAREREAFRSAVLAKYPNATFQVKPDGSYLGWIDDAFWGFQAGAAWQRTQSAGVPEGWRLVPVEPTPAMLVAINWPNDPAGYRAMLTAAPTVKAERVQCGCCDQVEVQRLREALETIAAYPYSRDQEMGATAMRKVARDALAQHQGEKHGNV